MEVDPYDYISQRLYEILEEAPDLPSDIAKKLLIAKVLECRALLTEARRASNLIDDA